MPKAINYLFTREKELRKCFGHAPSRIDNNLVENALRPIKLDAKNWLYPLSTRNYSGRVGPKRSPEIKRLLLSNGEFLTIGTSGLTYTYSFPAGFSPLADSRTTGKSRRTGQITDRRTR